MFENEFPVITTLDISAVLKNSVQTYNGLQESKARVQNTQVLCTVSHAVALKSTRYQDSEICMCAWHIEKTSVAWC